MLADLGRRIFRYFVVFSIIHQLIITLLIVAQVNVPEEFTIVPPIHYEQLQRTVPADRKITVIDLLVTGVLTVAWGVINFVSMLAVGIAVFFARMGNMLMRIDYKLQPLSIALTAFGGVLQFAVYTYYLQLILKYLKEYGE